MPGIDFNKLRQDITMEEVLNLLSFEPKQRSGDQWYGPCPLHASTSSSPRHFSVNVAIGRYRCHKCHSLVLKQANADGVLRPFLAAGPAGTGSNRSHKGRRGVSDCALFHVRLSCTQCG